MKSSFLQQFIQLPTLESEFKNRDVLIFQPESLGKTSRKLITTMEHQHFLRGDIYIFKMVKIVFFSIVMLAFGGVFFS